jgi:hypothetical protein
MKVPAYSFQAQTARAFLVASYNDVVVFVEDVSCSNMYVELINRVLAPHAQISHVFPLANRRAVVEAAKTFSPSKLPRPAVFLIDGDMDLLTGAAPPAGPPLYMLRAYCIENLLLNEHAIIEVAFESDANTARADIAARLETHKRLESWAAILRVVFETYAVAQELASGVSTVSFSVVRLLDDPEDPESLSVSRCAARARDIRSGLAAQFGWPTLKATFARVRSVTRSAAFTHWMISGKDYLLPLVMKTLQREFGFRDTSRALRVRLARHYAPDSERAFATVLRSLVPSWPPELT